MHCGRRIGVLALLGLSALTIASADLPAQTKPSDPMVMQISTSWPASAWNEHPNSKVRLIAGEGRTLGVELQMAPGWKTYWRMPGDAGVPPAFDWTGSTNIKAFDVRYPAPITMADQGGIAVGYRGSVIFPVTLTRDDDQQAATIALEFAFGVCKDICIPVESKLTLTVPANSAPWPASQLLAAALQRVPVVVVDPTKSNPALTRVTTTVTGATPRITFETNGATDVYAEAPDSLFVPLAHKTKTAAGITTFEIDLTKTPDLKELIGKSLRVTITGPNSAIEAVVPVQ
jgi:DsbC/DsbD-like thiol-disulfide interchange protein